LKNSLLLSGGSMGFWQRLVLGGSLVIAAPVLAEREDALDGGAVWEEVRLRLIAECGDPDLSDSIDQWAVLSCWEPTVQRYSETGEISQELAAAYFMEIEVRRSFLEGVREGEASCDGANDEEGDEGEDDWRDDEPAEEELVTVCHGAGGVTRGQGVTIEVPADVADRLIEVGGYEGPCAARDERRRSSRSSAEDNIGSNGGPGIRSSNRAGNTTAEKANKKSGPKKVSKKTKSSAKKGQKTQSKKSAKRSGKR
jgi:hypothetical protein